MIEGLWRQGPSAVYDFDQGEPVAARRIDRPQDDEVRPGLDQATPVARRAVEIDNAR